MSELPQDARCAAHVEVVAAAICGRCGAFCCERCARPLGEEVLCAPCKERLDDELSVSAEAKRALLFAVLGLNGLFPLGAAAAWLGRRELGRVARQETSAASFPYAQGALWLGLVDLALLAATLIGITSATT